MTHGWTLSITLGRLANAVCSVLIIACPCALGLAVPAALMVGHRPRRRRGILIRNIDALQNAERIDVVVLDKTGTITEGKPIVVDVIPAGGHTPEEILRLAAAVEQFSQHPLANAIVSAARAKNLPIPEPASFNSEPGMGVIGQIEGRSMLVGNREFIESHGFTGELSGSDPGHTLVFVACKSTAAVELLGSIALADQIKPDSADAIAALHAMGLQTVLLTGDSQAVADKVAAAVGIGRVHAQVKPAQKAEVIRALQSSSRKVAMVGDGVNDAPALAQADLSIAIGSGSDIAKETGDIVLVSGSLQGVAAAIRLSRATMRKIRQNLFLAFIYNVLAIPLAALGLLTPLIAAAAMAMSDVTVVGNALLLWRRGKGSGVRVQGSANTESQTIPSPRPS